VADRQDREAECHETEGHEADRDERGYAAVHHECDHQHGCPNPGDPCAGCDCICSGAIVKQSSVEELADSCHRWHACLTLCNTECELLDRPEPSWGTTSHTSVSSGRQFCALLSRFLL
jgi:hypothetical protein